MGRHRKINFECNWNVFMQFDELMEVLDNTQAIDDFVEGLTSLNALFLSNESPDVRVFSVLDEKHLEIFVGDQFGDGDNVIHFIVENDKTGSECSHFKLLLQGYSSASAKNYHLDHFLQGVKCKGIHSRCQKAVIVGMDGMFGELVSVPPELCCGYIPDVGTLAAGAVFDTLGELLPVELVWHTFKYLSHPLADIARVSFEASRDECSLVLAWLFDMDNSRF